MVAVTQRVSTDPEGNQGSPETLLIRNGHITAAPAHDDHQVPDGAPIDRAHTAAAHSDHATAATPTAATPMALTNKPQKTSSSSFTTSGDAWKPCRSSNSRKASSLAATASMLIPRSTCCAVWRP